MTIIPDSTTIYTVIITKEAGCQFFDTVVVTVVDTVTANAGKDTLICAGGHAQLFGAGGDSLKWSPGEGLSCTDCRNPVASPKTTTEYIFTASNAGGCIAIDTVTVTIWSGAVAGNDTTICLGASAQLHASGGVRYVWSPASTLNCGNCSDPIARPLTTTRYYLTVYNEAGCASSDSVLVTVIDGGSINAGPPQRICRGDSATLSATDGTTWKWSPVEGLSCSDCRSPKASPAATTQYRVTVSAAGGCTGSDTVTVKVHPVPDVDAGADVTLCTGGSATLHVSGGISYQWSPPDGLSCVDCAEPVATPKSTTIYHVIATNAVGCTASDSVTVTVVDAASVDAGMSGTICSGDSVQLQASDGATWAWSPSQGLNCTDCRSPMASPSMTTLYTVAVSAAGGCSGSDTVSVRVLPVPVIGAGEDVEVCAGATAQLHVEGGISYQWSPSDGLSCTDCADPLASPTKTTTYTVTGTNADGCTASDEVTVSVGSGRRVQAHIDRNHHLLPGTSLIVPMMLDEALGSIDTLMVAVNYQRGMLRVRGVETAGTQLDGWRSEVMVDTIGGTLLRLVAVGGAKPIGAGTLLLLKFDGYVGDTIASELPFSITLPNHPCLNVATTAGLVMLDSICGLSYRMIELTANKYVLKAPTPNPFNPVTRVEFSLGLDGATRMEILDANGERVAVLVEEYMQAGGYAVEWNAGAMSSGLYYVRLTSGAWTETRGLVLVK